MSTYRAFTQAEIRQAIDSGARYATLSPSRGQAPSPERVERDFLAQHRTPWRAALSSDRARWYVVSVEPQKEYMVQSLLRRDGFEVWLPERILVRELGNNRRVTGRIIRTKGPILPGYIMARFELADTTWHRITETRWVSGLLGNGSGKPLALTDGDIDLLHKIVKEHGGVVELRADGSVKKDLVIGEFVRVINDRLSGGFAGKEGQYVGPGANGTVKIQLDMLGRPQVLPFSEALVVPRETAEMPT